MKTYKALDHNGKSILTCWGKTEKEAQEVAERQLNRPGRRGHHKSWVQGGKRVVEVKS